MSEPRRQTCRWRFQWKMSHHQASVRISLICQVSSSVVHIIKMGDDDKRSERLGSNNPAMTIPANSELPVSFNKKPLTQTPRPGPAPEPFGAANNSTTTTSSDETRHAPEQHITVSNPTGDVEVIDEHTAPATVDSKYDHGWRRVVRNFSPCKQLSLGANSCRLYPTFES